MSPTTRLWLTRAIWIGVAVGIGAAVVWSAGFITDPEVLRYVRDTLAPARTLELWDPLGETPRPGMH